jgi:AraC family transcriptional activator of pyochelin receptor
MPTIARDTRDNSQVHTNNYVAADLNSDELIEEHKEMSFPSVKGLMQQWFFDDIRMSYSNLLYSDSNAVEWKGSLDVISMGFNLNGSVTVEGNSTGKVFNFQPGQHNIFYSGELENTLRNADRRSELFIIQFNKEAFLRLTEHTTDSLMRFREGVLAGKFSALGPENGMMDFEMQSIIGAIRNCQYAGGVRKMFFLSKCFEMLVLQARAFDAAAAKKYVYCKTDHDREKIVFAKEYLLAHLESPPTLPSLARAAGLNEFKLKKGFKEMFGTTVFNYLTTFRMELAREALLKNEKPITELAYELGYSSPQHFSKAFKKVFKVTPGVLSGKWRA